MNMPMDQRQSRVLAVAVLVVAVLLSYLVVVKPALAFRTAQKQGIEELQFQLSRYQQLAARQEEFEAALKRAQGRGGGGTRYYLSQSKPALASAELEQYLERILRSGNAQIVSTQAVSNAGDGVAPSVAVKVRMRADLITLVSLMHRIETGSPSLFIDNFVVTRRGGGQPSNPETTQTLLDVQFDMVGFLREEQ
jgi:general secretion pathway protein M